MSESKEPVSACLLIIVNEIPSARTVDAILPDVTWKVGPIGPGSRLPGTFFAQLTTAAIARGESGDERGLGQAPVKTFAAFSQ